MHYPFRVQISRLQFAICKLNFTICKSTFCFCKSKFKSTFKRKVTPNRTFSVTKNCDLQSSVNWNKLFAIVSAKLWPANLKPDTTQHSGLSHCHFVNKMAEHYLQWLDVFWKREELPPCPETHNIFSQIDFYSLIQTLPSHAKTKLRIIKKLSSGHSTILGIYCD